MIQQIRPSPARLTADTDHHDERDRRDGSRLICLLTGIVTGAIGATIWWLLFYLFLR